MRQHKYYVYTLIDPRTESVFYVGKGSGDRIDQHERDARSGVDHPKCKVINEIEAAGLKVKKEVVKYYRSEDAAYKHEERLIKKIGLENLTNLAKGGRNPYGYKPREEDKDVSMISAWALLARKSGGSFELVMTWCGEKIELDKDKLLTGFKKYLSDVIPRRGISWVVEEFKKSNINMVITSKVEHGLPA